MIALRPFVCGPLIAATAAIALGPFHRYVTQPRHHLMHGPPQSRSVCIEATISDGKDTLSRPVVMVALDGERAQVVISSTEMTLELAVTARVFGHLVALDASYKENSAGKTRALSTREVVNDRQPATLVLPDRQVVITPTRMGLGHDRCSR